MFGNEFVVLIILKYRIKFLKWVLEIGYKYILVGLMIFIF